MGRTSSKASLELVISEGSIWGPSVTFVLPEVLERMCKVKDFTNNLKVLPACLLN